MMMLGYGNAAAIGGEEEGGRGGRGFSGSLTVGGGGVFKKKLEKIILIK